MAGTIEGGRKAAATNKKRHGKDFYANIGRKGGSKSRPESRWWSLHPELAQKAGHKGGTISRRGPSKKLYRRVRKVKLTDEQIAIIKQELAEAE